MKPLSECLDSQVVAKLRKMTKKNCFPGIAFEVAMQFALTDGIIPEDNLPVKSFLHLEDWLRKSQHSTITFTATDLKNRLGTVLEAARKGQKVLIERHGRPIVQIEAYKDEPETGSTH